MYEYLAARKLETSNGNGSGNGKSDDSQTSDKNPNAQTVNG